MDFNIAVFSFYQHKNLLPWCLKSIKTNIHGYNKIFVIWDDYLIKKQIDFNKIKSDVGIQFEVIKHTEIYNWPKRIGRWGWIRQQLAKMLCYTYIENKRTLIVDGDVIFTGDPNLFRNNKIYLRQDRDVVVPNCYKHFMTKYLDISKFSAHTWVGSTCMFEHDILKKIDDICIEKNNMNLVECVNNMLMTGKHADLPFSEFETYGHFCEQHFRDRFIIDERNWCYPRELKQTPIKIMWADNKENDLKQKFERLCT